MLEGMGTPPGVISRWCHRERQGSSHAIARNKEAAMPVQIGSVQLAGTGRIGAGATKALR